MLNSPRHGYEPVNARNEIPPGLKPTAALPPAEWEVSGAPVPYPAALARMDERVESVGAGRAAELVWLLEHPPLYTAGTSARPGDVLDESLPLFPTGRG